MEKMELLNFNEALAWLESEPMEPITKRLIHLAIFHLCTKFFSRRDFPEKPWDARYFIEVMKDLFERHEYLKRILDGEKPISLFDDEDNWNGIKEVTQPNST